MTATRALTALGILLLIPTLAGSEPAEPRADDARPRRCVPVTIDAGEKGERGVRRRGRIPAFSAAAILDLELRVRLPRSKIGERGVELDLYTPKGHLYQTLSAPVPEESENGEARGRRRRSRRGPVELSATLPVAGTSIVTSSLYGAWSVEVRANGEKARCARPARFELTP